MRLKPSTVSAIAPPENKATCGKRSSTLVPWSRRAPQDTAFPGPKPRKERVDSARMTTPKPVVAWMTRGPRRFGTTCLRITWVGHSSTLVEIDGVRLLLDPIWSERSSPFTRTGPKRFHGPPMQLDELPDIDAVLIATGPNWHATAAMTAAAPSQKGSGAPAVKKGATKKP